MRAWRDLLQRWSDDWLDPVLHEQERAEPFPDDIRRARWLGAGGATIQDLDALEERVGAELPPTYRRFLLTTDGGSTPPSPSNGSCPSAKWAGHGTWTPPSSRAGPTETAMPPESTTRTTPSTGRPRTRPRSGRSICRTR
ncbi:SMI1/KNR4 family protein [Uniformispora flossi]